MKLSIAKMKLFSDIKQIYLFYKFNKELMEQEYTLTTELSPESTKNQGKRGD